MPEDEEEEEETAEVLAIAWLCPVCREPLLLEGRSLLCGNGHCFDIAKDGYCNLLLANRKHSKNPGDDKAMLRARGDFLNAGLYEPLALVIVDLLSPHLSASSTMLDCGCGDGYYAHYLHKALGVGVRGVDIARDGVLMAARRFKGVSAAQFAVANTFELPLPNDALDAVLQVFAPASDAEVRRVLKPAGVYCVVSPGPHHLAALKQLLYRDVHDHKVSAPADGFTLQDERRVEFEMNLERTVDITNLLAMTPLNWRGSIEGKRHVRELQQLTVEADFVVRTYSRDD